ncbi:MAG: type II toxin-antitoxin system HicB family antitoxin [Candidatus Coatesbacteria bacterium]|nr:type II toxin-antitoxin system HicB family antitoxin [Candidatus Coatesbacteria bacterium]
MRAIDVVFYREGRYWVAQTLNVDVSSFGNTLEEARAAVIEALELYFEDATPEASRAVSEARVEEVLVEAL